VSVRIDSLQALQVRFHEFQASTGRGVIAIGHQSFAKRGRKSRIHANNLLPQVSKIYRFFTHQFRLGFGSGHDPDRTVFDQGALYEVNTD
jgi:hypothetical protein